MRLLFERSMFLTDLRFPIDSGIEPIIFENGNHRFSSLVRRPMSAGSGVGTKLLKAISRRVNSVRLVKKSGIDPLRRLEKRRRI